MSTPRNPLLSIVIVNYNGLGHLKECLESVRAQAFTDYEVIFVDNASKDGSLEYVRENFPWIHAVPSAANLGFAGGNNLGFKHCAGDLVFLLNNDTRLASDTLERLVAAASERPDVGMFQAFLINYQDHSLSDSGGDTVYVNGFVSSLDRYPVGLFDKRRPIAAACGAATLCRKPLLDRLGGFDEDYFLTFEDLDLSFRARHLGETVLFLPEAKVYHKGSASLGGKNSDLSLFYSARNHIWFLAKQFPLVTLLKGAPMIVALRLLSLLVTASRGQLPLFLKANWHCLKGLPLFLRKRREVLGRSRLPRRDFEKMLRRNWFRERLAFHRGDRSLNL